MSEWLYLGLTPKDFAQENTSASGVSNTTTPSPYDVPEAARIDVDEAQKRLFIKFQYINNEPAANLPEEAGITFSLGKNSGRLYGIEVALDKVQEATVDGLTGKLTRTISSLADNQRLLARSNNYRMVCQAVQTEKNSLFAEVDTLML
jgi:hypothetical protein